MPTPGQELASIDFESMIGGPLIAVINAQAQSAMTTVNFIKEVGFKKKDTEDTAGGDTGTADPIYVSFKYPKELIPYQPATPGSAGVPGTPAVPAVYETQELKVPILTMLPIPYIRIDLVTIDFNAKINSVEYRKTDTNLKVDASLEANAGWLWGSAKLKVSTAYQRSTQQGSSVNRTYSLAIHVKAVQDEMPSGMEKILSILENAITSKPVPQPA
ncbi:MAG: DUF2589 domain-containing protein [Magnetococcales bacterium]|nr:DUF2589 domain-containing protein [Magnetococcales bacterium]